MRTNEERQQLIRERTLEIQREDRRRKVRILSEVGIVACVVFIIGLGCWLPGVTKQSAIARIDYKTGMASMLGQYDALGYICMGILAFALGVCVTVFLYRIQKVEERRQKEEHRQNTEEYRYCQGEKKQREKNREKKPGEKEQGNQEQKNKEQRDKFKDGE